MFTCSLPSITRNKSAAHNATAAVALSTRDSRRMPFSFGVQKKIFYHAFTFGFTTAPGTNTSQRIATRSIFLLEPKSDTPSGMFVGFDLMRQLP